MIALSPVRVDSKMCISFIIAVHCDEECTILKSCPRPSSPCELVVKDSIGSGSS